MKAQRRFLNKDQSQVAFVAWSVENESDWAQGEFVVSDCNRMVTLAFPLGAPENRKAALSKVVVLEKALAAFAMELRAAVRKMDVEE